jgi:FkbM family methyltransferase
MAAVTPARRVGEANRFRAASRLERLVSRVRPRGGSAAPAILKRAYEYVLDRWPGEHLQSTFPGGERVRLAARYRHLSWNPQEYAAFREAVRPGAVVLDVGANVGAYTLMFAEWVGFGGRVYAFEPAPDARTGLLTHLRLNHVEDRVEVSGAAMSSSVGQVPFGLHPFGGASSLQVDSADAVRVIDVPAETLDHFCAARRLRPDVIKIDVEGAELDVLRGGRETLVRPNVQVFVEFHPAVWEQRGIARAAIEQELARSGFTAESLDPAFDPWNTEGIAVRLRRVHT